MQTKLRYLPWAVVTCAAVSSASAAQYPLAKVTVVVKQDAPPMVRLAADEIRAYVYQLTSSWPSLVNEAPSGKTAIVLRTGPDDQLPKGGIDPSQNFALYARDGNQIVHGASDRATLWAAYQLVESWGVGFYLGGDAIPKRGPNRTANLIEAKYQPALTIRGNLPWFNFLNSPTTWNPQDYKTFFGRMAKQKANLINFHAYDHEPFCGYDITDKKVTMGGPLMTTISEHRWWSPHMMTTKDHLFGTDLFFDRGEWGCEVGIEEAWTFAPGRATRWQQRMMVEALRFARSRGIQTCLGFEVSGDPLDTKVQAALRKRITYVLKTYPLDYLGIWQAENLGVRGGAGKRDQDKGPDADRLWKAFGYFEDVKHQAEGVRMARHVRFAHRVMKELGTEARMVVSGWGGDQHMRFTDYYRGLDAVVPGDIIFAALDNIDPRSADHVSEVYGKLSAGRESWPIPWFESDAGHTRIDQTGPQTNVTAFEPLLKDIVRKGCKGALGIHWRTRNVEDVAGYLYRFAWNPKLTAAEFFRQYARDHYSPDDAERMARVHLRLEAFGPQYVGAVGTVECGSRYFNWFQKPRGPLGGHKPNLAGHLPDTKRFGELEAMSRDLLERSRKAATEGRRHAAIQYHDLAKTIEWLVKRARVGLAIWGNSAPLEKRLREAERLAERGKISRARDAARAVLADLEKLDFRGALQALAGTCRTRGELGMLTTANARYGRFYACFVQRIAHILGRPLPASRGSEHWKGPEVLTMFPAPNRVAASDTVSFDAVLLPTRHGTLFHVELLDLTGRNESKTVLPLERLGGAYYRVVFFPPGRGAWAWKLVPKTAYDRPADAIGLPEGVVTVGSTSNADGFVSLFNGKDLTGWIGDTKGYVIENGAIVCKPGGNLFTAGQYGDFVFRFEFKLTPGANNGLAIRAPRKGGTIAYAGIELQILDDTAEKYKNVKPYQRHGSIYGTVPAKRGHLKPVGQWNFQEVIANGRQITVKLNGATIVDADIDKASTPKTMDGKSHPGLKRTKGHIGFLGHGSHVEFRNIRIKELK